jgi:hypothetical protein
MAAVGEEVETMAAALAAAVTTMVVREVVMMVMVVMTAVVTRRIAAVAVVMAEGMTVRVVTVVKRVGSVRLLARAVETTVLP